MSKKKKWPHLFFGEKKKKKKNLPASSVFSKNGLRNNCIFFFGLSGMIYQNDDKHIDKKLSQMLFVCAEV